MKIYILGGLTVALVNTLFVGVGLATLLIASGMYYTGKLILDEA